MLDGNDKGGIDGNGQAWYDYAEDAGNVFGRWVPQAAARADQADLCLWLSQMPRMWSSRTFPSFSRSSGLVLLSTLRTFGSRIST